MCFRNEWKNLVIWNQMVLSWKLDQLEGNVLATAEENSAAIEAVATQLGKVKTEIVAKIEALQTASDQGQDLSGPINDLVLAAQALDDVVPDPAPEAPVEPEVPAEPEAPVEETEV